MPCRSEHATRENHAPLLRLQHRLSAISIDWINLRIRQHNRRVREHQRIRREARAARIIMTRKVRAWKREIRELNAKLADMKEKYHKNKASVKVEDWETLVEGQERKMQVLFGKKFPREKWPAGVPYLNFIALMERKGKRDMPKNKTTKKREGKLKPKSLKQRPLPTPTKQEPALQTNPLDLRHLERQNTQLEKQIALLRRSRINPASVSFVQWRDAVADTEAAEKDMTVKCFMELARRREAGGECDGWVFGRYYGPM